MVTMLSSSPRVWVRSNPCPFATSMFDTLSKQSSSTDHGDHYHRALVSIKEDPVGVVSLDNAAIVGGDPQHVVLPMGRARHCPELDSTPCPTTLMNPATAASKDTRTTFRHTFVQLAVAGLVLDPNNNNRLLMTRRPYYMRSFPGAWVLPGGSVDPNESLAQAIQREVYEETGLVTSTKDWKLSSLWESVYPTKFSLEDESVIRAHHLVVYLSATVSSASALRLCPTEVDGAVWIFQDHVPAMVHPKTKHQQPPQSLASSSFLRQQQQQEEMLDLFVSRSAAPKVPKADTGEKPTVPLGELMGIYPQPLNDGSPHDLAGGIAQGSLFALQEFISSSKNIAEESSF